MSERRCGKRYGARRKLICKRLAGHKGQHSQRLWLGELRKLAEQRRRRGVSDKGSEGKR